jgi:protein phosphatase
MSVAGAAPVTVVAGVRTDVGLKRSVNEDSVIAEFPVFAVADGMGGHEAGDRASRAVIEELRGLVGRDELTPDDVADVLHAAHENVRGIAEGTSRGAGSTVTGAVVLEHSERPHWLVFNIGDSRVYRLREREFAQLTVDHSIAQELIESGRLAREEVGSYSGRNVITRAVGSEDSTADFWLYPIVEGERLLICSDGLTGEVDESDVAAVLASVPDVADAAEGLVARALENGGKDNVTVVVVEVAGGGISAALDEETGIVPADGDDVDENTVELPKRV